MLTDPIHPSTRIQRAPSAISADVQGEVVILDTVRGAYVGLDSIGSDIWQRLEVPGTAAALIAVLADRYDAPLEQIEQDVADWLADMAKRGLIVAA